MTMRSQRTACVLWALVLLMDVSGLAQRTEERAESTAQASQDPVAELKKNREPYYVIRPVVLGLYKDAANRPRLLKLLEDPQLPSNVFTALALVFEENNERSTIPLVLDALVAGRLKESDEIIRRFTLERFHESESIFPELKALVLKLQKKKSNASGLKEALLLFPRLVAAQRTSEYRTSDAERYAAMTLLLECWRAAKTGTIPSLGTAYADTLSRLVAGAVRFETLAAWEQWFKPYERKNERDRNLPIARIYADIVDRLRSENDALKKARRDEVTALIERMRAAGEAPTRFLLDADPALRKIAFITFRSMADSLAPEQRTAAIQGVIDGLTRVGISEDIYRGLVQAAGPLGEKAEKSDRSKLITALLRERPTDVAETWRSRVKALGKIGALDEPQRLASLYDLANRKDLRTQDGWRQLRLDIVKLVQQLRLGMNIVERALADTDPEVRGIAAVVIGVLNNSVEKGTVGKLVAAIAAERDKEPLNRMFDALVNITSQKPAVVEASHLKSLMALDLNGDESRQPKRLKVILLAFASDPARFASQKSEAMRLVQSSVNAKNPRLRARLLETITETPCDLVIPALVGWLKSADNADSPAWEPISKLVFSELDRTKTWPVHVSDLWSTCLTLAANSPSRAAMFSARVLERAEKLAALPDSLKLTEMIAAHENWVFEGGVKKLFPAVVARRDRLLKEKPGDVTFLLSRADLLERLSGVWEEERDDLLVRGEADLRTALAQINSSGAAGRKNKIGLDLARIQLLQDKPAAARETWNAVAPEGRDSGRGFWLDAAIATFGTSSSTALRKLSDLPENRRGQSPLTFAWLKCSAGGLSSDVGDWAAASEGLPTDADGTIKQLLNQRLKLKTKLESVLRARMEGKISPEEDAVAAKHKAALVSLAASRSLAALNADRPAAQKIAGLLVKLTENKKLGWPVQETEASLAALAAELGKIKGGVSADQKLRRAFLKKVGTHLYSLD